MDERENEVTVLVATMDQGRQAMAGLRARAERTVTHAVTVCLLLDGWIVQAETSPEVWKTVCITFVLASIWVSAVLYMGHLERCFKNNDHASC